MSGWILAITKPNHENIAAESLHQQGYAHYLPKFLEKSPYNKPPRIRPLFSRYIFVFIVDAWYSLKSTRGLGPPYVIMGEDRPQTVPTIEIEKLKKRENEKGLVQLAPKPKFEAGAVVKATHGPLEGVLLIYEGMTNHERCNVLAEMLGQQCRVQIDEKLLIAA